jgi:hypothetical protein
MASEGNAIVRSVTLAVLVASCGTGPEGDLTNVQAPLYQPPNTSLWHATRTLPVCWLPGQRLSGASWDTQKAQIRAAVTRSWEAAADLKFTWQDCPMNGSDRFVTVKIVGKTKLVAGQCCDDPNNPDDCCGWDGGTTHYYGTSGLTLPQDVANNGAETVNFTFRDDGREDSTQQRVDYLAIHEFGHVLGFRHEQDRVEYLSEPDCGVGEAHTVDDGRAWTPYDPSSVMNYCAPNPTRLSQLDVMGIRKAYAFHQKDFNGDLGSDVLWHHGESGQLGSWLVVNGNVIGTQNIDWPVTAASGWIAVGTGDFNLDGKQDVLWHHAGNNWVNVWMLDGAGHVTSNPTIETTGLPPSQGWRIAGTGDFNSDGSTDILWHNTATGVLKAWLMRGTIVMNYAEVSWQVAESSGWKIVGTGDFNRDGYSDVLWHHGGTGQVSAWLLNGATVITSTVFSWTSPASAGWAIVGTGDFNHDGMSDVLWHHGQSGVLGAWIMNSWGSPEVLSRLDLSWQAASSSGWRVVSP